MKEHITTKYLARTDTALGLLLNYLFDGVYIVDKSRKIIFWNKGAEQLTGFAANEVYGRKCSDNILNHIDENGNLLCKSKYCPLVRIFKNSKHVIKKVYPLHKSGRRFPTLTYVAPIEDENGEIIAGIEVFRDISKEEDYRILQEKFTNFIKKYVSTTTFETVMERIQLDDMQTSSMTRDITILSLDIVDFTTFSEKSSPKDVVKMLNEMFGICGVITEECHGDIDKFIGDAIMAVFVDANDAVLASEKILTALTDLNTIRTNKGRQEVNVRLGINSGKVIQGDIGTVERKDLTVIGDAVNIAARIQTVTAPNSISISEATFSRLKNPNSFTFKEEVIVKGKTQPVRIFRHNSYPIYSDLTG